ncbi:serine/threonine-protein kinase [Streptomyces sp. NPDC046887]|uniref:serine/threonine-protein kinase n=1 Tax=Streptomyces sp. NPDC046887 TaxID=3155472 RepID=UPI0033E9526E
MTTNGSDARVRPARPGDPERIGPYRITGRLGSGGMGTVHAGLDPSGLRVAVKVIHAAQAEDPEWRARFRREVQLSARVQGPCLIPLLAADPEAAAPWLATAYAPGLTLDRHLAEHGPLTGGTLYAFATGTARALAAVHAAGVVHRDVKPQNVILTGSGPRVLDFGIAHAADGTSVTRTGMMTGTPGWISPEHYRTGSPGPAGDVFAWGALVGYAATGRPPFGTGNADVVAYRVLSGEADLDGVPGELRAVVDRALAKDPGGRMSAAAAAEECARLLAGQATQVLPTAAAGAPTAVAVADRLVAAEWRVPPVADPAWPAPPAAPRSVRKGVLLAALGAAVAGAAFAGSLYFQGTFDGKGEDDAKRDGGTVAAGPDGGDGKPVEDGPLGGGQVEDGQAGSDTASGADPREARVPRDPLAGVDDPAYTRAGDGSQPSPDEWRASTSAASGSGEEAAERTIRERLRTVLATKGLDAVEPVVSFNRRAQTVMVTGGPVSQLPDEHRNMFARAAGAAACATLAQRLADAPAAWPYGRFAVYWKDAEAAPEAEALDFGEATGGCSDEVAGQWHGDEAGLATAEIPSTPPKEVQVADAAVKDLIAAWNAQAADFGEEPISTTDGISLGFDPVENAAYIWTDDPYARFPGRAQRSNLAGAVQQGVCGRLLDAYTSDRNWTYIRWTLAVGDGEGGRELVRSGTCAR